LLSKHSPLVALDGHAQLSASETPVDYGRFRRQQRRTVRLWKWELQKLADEIGLEISVCHSRPAPASGTRSNIGCSLSSARTGGATAHQSRSHHQPYCRTTTAAGLVVKKASSTPIPILRA